MKASELKKKPLKIEDIYKSIESANEYGAFKHNIPHNVYVPDEIKLQLMKDGFKVYEGDWDGVMRNCLIIEW